jgi:hypothetical protein
METYSQLFEEATWPWNPVIDDEPSLPSETENKLMDDILVLFIKNKLTPRQSQDLLERLSGIIEKVQQVAKFRRPPSAGQS